MYHSFKVLIFCLLLSFPLLLSGQGTGNSPFSQFGIGDMTNNNGNIRNMGMGYAGVSARNHYFINLLNPALLPNLKTAKKPRPNHHYKYYDYYRNQYIDSTVKIDFSVTYQRRSIQSPNGTETSGGMNVAYLAFALPLSKTWATSFGIYPIASANYNLNYSDTLKNIDSVANNSYSGKGGIYKMFWAHGFGITDNLSVGLESAFVFGNINTQSYSSLPNLSSNSYGFKTQNRYSAFSIKPGINFRREIVKVYHDTIYEEDSTGQKTKLLRIKKTKSSGAFYNIGLTCDYFTSMNIHQNLNLYVITNTNIIRTDTTIQSNTFKAKVPPTFRLGFSIDKPLRWTVAADAFYGAWSMYKPSNSTDTLGNSYGFTLGGEFTPGQLKLKSRTYRLGFTYVKLPVIHNGAQLDDISVSIGGTIPFGRKASTQSGILPRLNVAIVAGQRGNISTIGIKEQYIKAFLGIVINEKWFNKRKIY
jgi:hypothetical protein